MPLWTLATLLALCAVASLAAAVWLLLHLTALSHALRGRADLVPPPARPRASTGAVLTALAIFNLGWIASVAIWIFALGAGG